MAELLLEWRPPKLSVPAEHCTSLPLAVASSVEFLAHTRRPGPAE